MEQSNHQLQEISRECGQLNDALYDVVYFFQELPPEMQQRILVAAAIPWIEATQKSLRDIDTSPHRTLQHLVANVDMILDQAHDAVMHFSILPVELQQRVVADVIIPMIGHTQGPFFKLFDHVEGGDPDAG